MPKAYLRNFCLKVSPKEVYRSLFIQYKKEWSKPKLKSINSICFEKDFYDVPKSFAEEKNINKDHIERNAFWYEKDFIASLIKGMNTLKFTEETILRIPEFYLNMVMRNSVFRNALKPEAIERLIRDEMAVIRVKMSSHDKIIENPEEKTLIMELIKQHEDNLILNNTKGFMHSSILYQQSFGKSPSFDGLLRKLDGYKIMCAKIMNENEYFITSNSPGTSIDIHGNINSFKFSDDFAHYMPLSSKYTLILFHPSYNFQLPSFSITEANTEVVNKINRYTLLTSKTEIYCENDVFLSEIINGFMSNY